jgi:hypothetical protein
VIEILFGLAGLIPQDRSIDVMQHGITWNYTSVLDLIALVVSAVLVWRFMTVGRKCLRTWKRLGITTTPATRMGMRTTTITAET